MMNKLAPYRKTVVAVLGVILSGLNIQYGNNPKVQLLIGLTTAIGVYTTPNKALE